MYSILVANAAAEQTDGVVTFERSRFLEGTDSAIAAQLSALSLEAQDCLRAWPCIFMQEGRGDEKAFLVRVSAVSPNAGRLSVSLEAIPASIALSNDELWRLRALLDIGEFEFNRHHWAVKSRDLLGVLQDAGHEIPVSVRARFTQAGLPAPSRAELLRAKSALTTFGHTDLDDLIIEAGVNDLSAGRELGSIRNRANAIVQYTLAHPEAVTAENSLFSAFVWRRALRNAAPAVMDAGELATTGPRTATSAPDAVEESSGRSPNRVFVVHGQDDTARGGVVSFLQAVGLVGIVLHDQPNMGRHLLTKFIDEAELVTFAVVLMTADDIGGSRDGEMRARARQNVILELGYFLAHLGQKNVCAIISPGLETPSDFDGIVYIRMTESGEWKKELERELRAAGMPVVHNAQIDS